MSTTVRIRSEDKARLDRLQARFLLERGERLTLDNILHRMLEVAARHEDEVLGAGPSTGFTAEERKRILALPYDFGIETQEETIDDGLYGRDEA